MTIDFSEPDYDSIPDWFSTKLAELTSSEAEELLEWLDGTSHVESIMIATIAKSHPGVVEANSGFEDLV